MSLTFAGVGGSLRSLGVPVEAGLAALALASLGVVQTVAHAAAALARLAPHRPIKVAALSVSVTLAHCGSEGEDEHVSGRHSKESNKVYFICAGRPGVTMATHCITFCDSAC